MITLLQATKRRGVASKYVQPFRRKRLHCRGGSHGTEGLIGRREGGEVSPTNSSIPRHRARSDRLNSYARRQAVNIQTIAALPPIPTKHMRAKSGFPASR